MNGQVLKRNVNRGALRRLDGGDTFNGVSQLSLGPELRDAVRPASVNQPRGTSSQDTRRGLSKPRQHPPGSAPCSRRYRTATLTASDVDSRACRTRQSSERTGPTTRTRPRAAYSAVAGAQKRGFRSPESGLVARSRSQPGSRWPAHGSWNSAHLPGRKVREADWPGPLCPFRPPVISGAQLGTRRIGWTLPDRALRSLYYSPRSRTRAAAASGEIAYAPPIRRRIGRRPCRAETASLAS
jgi:hypothetical protein